VEHQFEAGGLDKNRNQKSSWLRSLGSGINRYLKRAERFSKIQSWMSEAAERQISCNRLNGKLGRPGGFSDVFVIGSQMTGYQQQSQEAVLASDPVDAVADSCDVLGVSPDTSGKEILESLTDPSMSQNCSSIFSIRRMDGRHRKPLWGRILFNRPLVRDFFGKKPFDPGFFSQGVTSSLEQPSPFFLSCRALKSAEDQLQAVFNDYVNKKATRSDVERATFVRDEHNHACFRAFAAGLGCRVDASVRFSKKLANDAMESCLGSANVDPSFNFHILA